MKKKILLEKFFKIQDELFITDKKKHDENLKLLGSTVKKYTTPSGLRIAERKLAYHNLKIRDLNYKTIEKIIKENIEKFKTGDSIKIIKNGMLKGEFMDIPNYLNETQIYIIGRVSKIGWISVKYKHGFINRKKYEYYSLFFHPDHAIKI